MAETTLPPEVLKDREFGPVCWLLSCELVAHVAWRHVDLEHRRVDWEPILDWPCSSGERLLIELALNLWNGHPMETSPYEWAGRLSYHYWVRVMEALALARGVRMDIAGGSR